MLSKEDHIEYWKKSANDSWETANYLKDGRKYSEALFLYCLAIEKYLKAHWVKDNKNNFPPRIHDLRALYSETTLDLDAHHIDFMDTISRWNIEGRYPDYRFTLKKIATEQYMNEQLEKLKSLRECLL